MSTSNSFHHPTSNSNSPAYRLSPARGLLLLAFLLLSGSAFAAPIVVDSTAWGDDLDNSTCTAWEAVKTAKDQAATGGCSWSGDRFVELQSATTYITEGHFPKVAVALEVRGNGATLQMANPQTAQHFFKVKAGASLSLHDLTLSGGRGWRGGAVQVYLGGTLDAFRVTFRDNLADDLGGAIFSRGNILLTHCTLEQNSALDGGAVATLEGNLTIRSSTLADNQASDRGGAVWISTAAAQVLLDNSTFSANQAFRGGALFRETTTSSTPAEIYQSTFAGNSLTAQGSGGALYLEGGAPLTLAKSALHAPAGSSGLCAGSLAGLSSLGNNAATDASCQLTHTTDQPTATFSFSELVDHGGFTRIHAPLCDAPAGSGAPCSVLIDQYPCQALNVEGTDQRGYRRAETYGGLIQASSCDLGAYESLCEAGTLSGSTLLVFLPEDQLELDGTLLNSGACAGMVAPPTVESPPTEGCQVQWNIYGPTLGIEAIWFLEDGCQEDCFTNPAACQQHCTTDPTDWQAGLPLDLEVPVSPPAAGSPVFLLDAPTCEVGPLRYVIELSGGTFDYWDPLLEIETGDGGP